MGTACVTLPVAAHSAPRWNVAMNATLFNSTGVWPSAAELDTFLDHLACLRPAPHVSAGSSG